MRGLSIICFLGSFAWSVLPLKAAGAGAQRAGPARPVLSADRSLHVGDSDIYEFNGITATAVGDPTVADIMPLSTRRLLVNAKGTGKTTLFVFDRTGKHVLHITVLPIDTDLGPVAAQIQTDIGLPDVSVRAINGVIFLEGTVSTDIAAQRAGTIASVYADKVKNLLTVVEDKRPSLSLADKYSALLTENLAAAGISARVVDDQTIVLTGQWLPAPRPSYHRSSPAADHSDASDQNDILAASSDFTQGAAKTDALGKLLASLPHDLRVINLVDFQARPAQQVLVHAKIIDIDRSALKDLGVQWGSLNLSTVSGGHQYVLQPQPILFGQAPGDLYDNPLSGGGPLRRFLPLAAELNALIQENKARILSEPSIVVLDGNEGSILVGGEIPIPVSQTNNGYGGAAISVDYKSYGVKLDVYPAIVADGVIQLTVSPEVSDLDYGNGVQYNGLTIPALGVRRATSTLQMHDGETLVIGGLYSNTTSRQIERIPLLSQIPVLGEFFKNTRTVKEERELMILIQPEIVTPDTAGVQPPAPGSLENLPINKPDVGRHELDQDFPDINNLGRSDLEKPNTPINLPPITPSGASGGNP